jgi:hypothetical protein
MAFVELNVVPFAVHLQNVLLVTIILLRSLVGHGARGAHALLGPLDVELDDAFIYLADHGVLHARIGPLVLHDLLG